MTGPLHLARVLTLAALDLAIGGLIYVGTASPIGLLVVAIGLLLLVHAAHQVATAHAI